MAFTAEQHREYRSRRKAEGNPRPSGPSGPSGPKSYAPFIAIDGEALGESGYHLLAASTGQSIENMGGLTSRQCIEFLIDLRKAIPRGIFIGFALGYDCEHWIKDFGIDAFRSLRDHGECEVRIGRRKLVIEYIPRKWFKIRRPGQKFGHLIQVFDVFSFFQASFLSVIGRPEYADRMETEFPHDLQRGVAWKKILKDGWGACTEEELVAIQKGKSGRGAFTREGWEDVKRYNALECDILVRLANKLRDALYECDIRLRSWHGPGAVANALLKRYNMGGWIDKRPPPEVQDAIKRAFFGGRFQVFQVGHIKGVYDYDISSAYPYATSLLPSATGVWEHVSAYDDTALWALWKVSWDVEGLLTPFPWRDPNGCIHYPPAGCGWYWGWEVAAARRGWGDAIRVEQGWVLHPEREGVFQWVTELADKRVAAKQAAKMLSGDERDRMQAVARAYKLALNSLYGKTIQTVGRYKLFLCPMWAGLITSHTRARLLNAALDAPTESIVCFATDGLFSAATIADLSLGDSLGDWELAADNIRLELYQSGCYAIYEDEVLKDSKFRGVSRSEVPWTDLRALWERHGMAGRITIQTKRFVGHRTALAHNKPEQQATWQTLEKEVVLHPGVGFPVSDTEWRSFLPHLYDYAGTCSHPYRKLVSGETDLELAEAEVQP